jgi:hypothetical protein
MKKIFKYIEPIWLGTTGKPSIRRVLSLVFSFNLVYNISQVISSMDSSKSISDATLLLGIEAGLITAMLSLTTYSNALKYDDTNKNKDLEV